MTRKLIVHRLILLMYLFFTILYLLSIFSIYLLKQFDNEISDYDGLVGYWNFDKKYDNIILDISNLENHAIINGAKIIRQSAYFDGIDDNIEVADRSEYSISNTGEITILLWVRPTTFDFKDTYNNYVNFLGKGNSYDPANQEWGFRVYSDSHKTRARNYVFYVFNISGGLGVGSTIENKQIEGKWVHIVGMVKNNKTKIYFNGELEDIDPYSRYSIVPQNGNSSLFFGYRDTSGGHFQGGLDEIMIFNRSLTDNEIKKIYHTQKKLFE